jgi:hypothetical protein
MKETEMGQIKMRWKDCGVRLDFRSVTLPPRPMATFHREKSPSRVVPWDSSPLPSFAENCALQKRKSPFSIGLSSSIDIDGFSIGGGAVH